MNLPQFSPSPPMTLPPWQLVPNSNTLAAGVNGIRRIQVVASVAGQMPSPLQRLGLVAMPALGILPPDVNESPAQSIGSGRYPAAPSVQLLAPVLTMNGMRVTALPTSANRG